MANDGFPVRHDPLVGDDGVARRLVRHGSDGRVDARLKSDHDSIETVQLGPRLASAARVRIRARDRIVLEIAWDEIAALGPAIEVVASEADLVVRLPEVPVTIYPSAETPSRIWYLIQRGADESVGQMMAAGMGVFDRFREVRTVSGDASSARGAEPATPQTAQDHPAGLFDKEEWHSRAAAQRRRPVHSHRHVPCLARHQRHAHWGHDRTRCISASEEPSRQRQQSEGRGRWQAHCILRRRRFGAEFTRWYYGGEDPLYLEDWRGLFPSLADTYLVPDSPTAYDKVERVIDQRFAQWWPWHASGS